MKKHIVLFAVIFTLFPLSVLARSRRDPFAIRSSQIKTKTFKKENKKPKRSIKISYPVLDVKSKAADRLNLLVWGIVSRKQKAFTSEDTYHPIDTTSALVISYATTFYRPEKLISMQFRQYTYFAGNAHPSTTTFVINYDLASARQIKLANILQSPRTDLKFIANYVIAQLRKKKLGEVNFINDGARAKFKNYDDWNFTRKGLRITFDPYHVAAYVFGPQTVIVPYKILKGHIKSRYYKLVGS